MKTKHALSIVVAAAEEHWGIGWKNAIPWRLPTDLKRFREITVRMTDENAERQHAVIMGRKTWESLPPKFRPLPQRLNVVLTRNAEFRESANVPADVAVASSLTEALEIIDAKGEAIDQVFVIGGSAVYEEALGHPACNQVHLTTVKGSFECDAFFPSNVYELGFRCVSTSEEKEENGITFQFKELRRDDGTKEQPQTALADATTLHEECQYLDLIRKIMNEGVQKGDRTGTGTVSIFGAQMRFNLRNDVFPVLTTKRVFWRGVAEELLWFISGDTNAKTLQDKDIHIWDGNGSKEYLGSIGLGHREAGDLGPVYGFQWRHFGAKYTDMHADYTGQGVDQLAEVIHKLKTNPNDRRILLSAWNPADLKEMALPPCHMFCQFYVANGELSCQMYQRSADMGLGVPFNIASYALLTRLIAQVAGLKAGDFVHVIGDAHIYLNHLEPLKIQLGRTPRPFPTLRINPEKTNIDDFEFGDFELDGYKPHGTIKMAMSV
ncbi:hypothetical protein Poli38472_003706 [Pythium oligandrum]|uniref:Bifunctional dihydrofolate reductase-thymidylate synthase n=1 Tax=Pythium oligandrum TaxID=41045 RepID=A0A8K1FKD7_PYTOL|nr:hypothetical protein Poli38472_003706 [Pythium oligandrum]|eukprot:TMW65941.1 hypothetical protein Poli38472_003706 [Pythium oligandrum]